MASSLLPLPGRLAAWLPSADPTASVVLRVPTLGLVASLLPVMGSQAEASQGWDSLAVFRALPATLSSQSFRIWGAIVTERPEMWPGG